jgi:hypothetical protein
MKQYKIKAIVDQQWFDILGQITRHQDGFLWESVKEVEKVECECGYEH